MAGWISWQNVSLNVGNSVGQTVLETLWPQVQEIAAQQQWVPQVWTDRLLAGLCDTLVSCKCAESPLLDQSQEMQQAVLAGELYANSQFHIGVLRFQDFAAASNWLMQYVRRTPPPHDRLGAAERAAVLALPLVADLLPGANGARPGWNNNMTFEAFVVWLYYSRANMNNSTIVASGLVHYISGMSKMGQMSGAWRRSRERQIRREAGNNDLELSAEVAQHVWDIYGVALKPRDESWGPLFVFFENQCRAKGLTRLFVTAQQSAEQGCTVLTLIADARKQCADFNWGRFIHPHTPAERQIQGELNIWIEDYRAMKANPWIRFSGGVGRSPQMSNLGYLAKRLLTKAKGVSSVENYNGLDAGNLTITYRPWIERVVGQYIEAVAAEVADDAGIPVLAPLDRRAYPDIIDQNPARPVALELNPPGGQPPAGNFRPPPPNQPGAGGAAAPQPPIAGGANPNPQLIAGLPQPNPALAPANMDAAPQPNAADDQGGADHVEGDNPFGW